MAVDLNLIFGGVTALATTVGGGVAVWELMRKLRASADALTVKGRSYFHRGDSALASFSVTFEVRRPCRLRCVRVKGRRVSLGADEPRVAELVYGLTFDNVRKDVHETFFIEPAPADGEAIELLLDVGDVLRQTVRLYPSDFTSSGFPDRGRWPVQAPPAAPSSC